MEKRLTSKQAAEQLGISDARVRQLVLAGKLPAEKFGRDLIILESDLEPLRGRKPGRPAKAKNGE
ncbi:MAG: helix-turn-helix domain-containing protein [Acidobacteriota bacterium]|nr:helix-turn-helix domain-containing protein [Acidobacteriota bacterium]